MKEITISPSEARMLLWTLKVRENQLLDMKFKGTITTHQTEELKNIRKIKEHYKIYC